MQEKIDNNTPAETTQPIVDATPPTPPAESSFNELFGNEGQKDTPTPQDNKAEKAPLSPVEAPTQQPRQVPQQALHQSRQETKKYKQAAEEANTKYHAIEQENATLKSKYAELEAVVANLRKVEQEQGGLTDVQEMRLENAIEKAEAISNNYNQNNQQAIALQQETYQVMLENSYAEVEQYSSDNPTFQANLTYGIEQAKTALRYQVNPETGRIYSPSESDLAINSGLAEIFSAAQEQGVNAGEFLNGYIMANYGTPPQTIAPQTANIQAKAQSFQTQAKANVAAGVVATNPAPSAKDLAGMSENAFKEMFG
jgi:uncharacterized phage-like protein YoqJ